HADRQARLPPLRRRERCRRRGRGGAAGCRRREDRDRGAVDQRRRRALRALVGEDPRRPHRRRTARALAWFTGAAALRTRGSDRMSIRHVVSWKLAEEDAALRGEQAAEVARRLNALMGVVPELRAVSAGANIAHPDDNWDVTLVADVDSLDALEA